MDKTSDKKRLLTRIRVKRFREARTAFYSRIQSHTQGRYIKKYNFIIHLTDNIIIKNINCIFT